MTERDEFERWLEKPRIIGRPDPEYAPDVIQRLWQCWQAAYAAGVAAERERAARELAELREYKAMYEGLCK